MDLLTGRLVQLITSLPTKMMIDKGVGGESGVDSGITSLDLVSCFLK